MIDALQKLQIDDGKRAPLPGQSRVSSLGRKWLLLLALPALAVPGGWLLVRPSPAAVAVLTVSASAAPSAAPVLTAGGYVKSARVVYVVPRVSGRIASLLVSEGDEVAQGALLATLDSGDLSAQVEEAKAGLRLAQASLARLVSGARPEELAGAEAKAEGARLNRDRLRRERARSEALLRAGAVSGQAHDQVSTEALVAEQGLEAARQALALLEAGPKRQDIEAARAAVDAARARLARAERQLEHTLIRAPLAGRVLEKYLEVGDSVSPEAPFLEGYSTVAVGSPVVSIGQLEGLEASIDLAEKEVGRVALGQSVRLVPGAFPERTFTGKVARIAPRADRNKGTIEVRVRFDDPAPALAHDSSVTLTFVGEAPARASPEGLSIPAAAVVERGGSRFVFVVEDGRARLRPVRTGEARSNGTLAVTGGLSGGEQLVVSDLSALDDGSPVRLRHD